MRRAFLDGSGGYPTGRQLLEATPTNILHGPITGLIVILLSGLDLSETLNALTLIVVINGT